jgi:hypothetical protein
MRPFEREDATDKTPRRVTVNSLLLIVVGLGMFALGMNYRNNALSATVVFEDQINGITAQLPANWLIDTESEAYVLRVEDVGGGTFNPVIQIDVETVGENAVPRNVVDQINLRLSVELDNYKTLEIAPVQFGEDEATQITYAFVSAELNPFLQAVPVVVQGVDLVVIRGNQALIFSFRDNRETFEVNRDYFERFLASVEY